MLVFTFSPKYINSYFVKTTFKLNNYNFKVCFLIVPSSFPVPEEGEATLTSQEKVRRKEHPVSWELGWLVLIFYLQKTRKSL